MKNKKMLLIAGVLAAFLMLAVPFAVASVDSEDVDAVDSGTTTVTDEDELNDALSNESIDTIIISGEITLSNNLNINRNITIISDGLDGFTVDGNDNDVTISGITSSAGILVKNAGNVIISNCEVTGSVALEKDSKTNGGILVSQSNSATISNNSVTCDIEEDNKSFFGVGVQKVMSAVISYNEIYGIDNAVWADMTLPGEVTSDNKPIKVVGSTVTINGNSLSWGSDEDGFDGRGIRSESYDKVMINGNTFILNLNETIDAGNVAKITYTGEVQFKGNFIGGADKADCGIDFIDSTGKDVFVDIASNFGENAVTADGNWYIADSIECSLMYINGEVVFGSNFRADQMMEFKVPKNFKGSISISADDGAYFNGLYLNMYYGPGNRPQDVDSVSVSNIHSSNGIMVNCLNGNVTIEDCEIIGDIGGEYNGTKISGIYVNHAKTTVIQNNIIEFTGVYSETDENYYGINLLRCGPMVTVSNNQVYNAPDNAFCYQNNGKYLKSDVELTISGNIFSEWGSNYVNGEGRGLRAAGVKDISASSNQFFKSYSDPLMESGNLAKVNYAGTFNFENNLMNDVLLSNDIKTKSGCNTFIDAGTVLESLTIDSDEVYNCFDITIVEGIEIKDGGLFYLTEGGTLSLKAGAMLNGTIEGPDGARITFTGIVAGPGGATLTGGSIIAGGMFTSGSVTINTPDNVLDGTFDDVDIIANNVEVIINENVVFTNGTTVTLKDGASFSEDPVFEEGTSLTIKTTGAPDKTIVISETSKVSSTGQKRVGFTIDVLVFNGYAVPDQIMVFEGDLYFDYLYLIEVYGYIGYEPDYIWYTSSGEQIDDYTYVSSSDDYVRTGCNLVLPSTEPVEPESEGFSTADYATMAGIVIAVVMLIGLVCIVRRN